MKGAALVLAAAWAGIVAGPAWAAPAEPPAALPFSELLSRIERDSPAQRGAELEAQAARSAGAREGRYRRPEVYLRGQYVNTNDPARTFMSRLGQREVEAADFQASHLNNPDPSTFGEVALGVALPLYEGGYGQARVAATASSVTAAEQHGAAERVQRFAGAFLGYGTLLSLRGAAQETQSLAQLVDATLAGYEVGGPANPVGYSGGLALKSVALRLKLLAQDIARGEETTRAALSGQAGLDPARWRPEPLALDVFVQAAGGAEEAAPPGTSETFRTRALRAQAATASHEAAAADAALRPRVGLFVEGNALAGERGTGNSYVAGAYLRWNLYSPVTGGASEEARLRGAALLERANAQALEDRVARSEATLALQGSRASLALLRESAALLDEQVRTSRTLFARGTINAAQLAEAYARRAETIQASLGEQQALLQAAQSLILHRADAPHAQ